MLSPPFPPFPSPLPFPFPLVFPFPFEFPFPFSFPFPSFPFAFPASGVGVACGGCCCGGDVTAGLSFPGRGVFFGTPKALMRGMEGSEMGKSGSPRRLLEPPELELELPFEECFARRNRSPCIFEVPRERERRGKKKSKSKARKNGIHFFRRTKGKGAQKGRRKFERKVEVERVWGEAVEVVERRGALSGVLSS